MMTTSSVCFIKILSNLLFGSLSVYALYLGTVIGAVAFMVILFIAEIELSWMEQNYPTLPKVIKRWKT
jgi:hypothetical protein